MWEDKISINEVFELRCRTKCYFGVGAIKKIDDIADALKKMGVKKVLIMSGRAAYKVTGAWDHTKKALEDNDIKYALYDKVTPNPTTASVDEAVAFCRDADAVIGIGGGSPIDAAKSAAIMLRYPGKTCSELYEFKFMPDKAAPVVAINLTHGTGTEVNRFAVCTISDKNYKPAIAYDCIYPMFSIDDPGLMTTLSPAQTRYVSIDAVNHVVEAATSKAASPYSVMLANEVVRLVIKYLPVALKSPKDLTARYYLLLASALAGIAFDNGMLHFTHALEHPLSAVKPELAHGLGLSLLLPSVIRHSYVGCPEVLAEMFKPLLPRLKGVPEEGATLAKAVEDWLKDVGVPEKLGDLGFTENDLDTLVELSFNTPSLDALLALAPIPATRETVKAIYRESLRPMRG